MLGRLNKIPHEVDKIRLFDFYLSAPYAIKLFRTNSRKMLSERNSILNKLSRYDEIDNSKFLFYEAKILQITVLSYLSAKNIISTEEYKNNRVVINLSNSNPIIDDIKDKQKSIPMDVMNLIENELQDMPLLGNDGLKDRSNLLEYRYDAL
ncbi:MAG: hypothetical protein Q7T44_08330 [Parvibaculum sp.]|nr:hypothetical protein [Parvibaculum sp.]